MSKIRRKLRNIALTAIFLFVAIVLLFLFSMPSPMMRRNQLEVNTRTRVLMLMSVIGRYEDHYRKLPTSLAQIFEFEPMEPAMGKDAWGTEIAFHVQIINQEKLIKLSSAGDDRIFDTDDDIVEWYPPGRIPRYGK